MQKINGKKSLAHALLANAARTLEAALDAQARREAGTPLPGDSAIIANAFVVSRMVQEAMADVRPTIVTAGVVVAEQNVH